jgi:outer membrane protein assembly factor BamB
MKSARILALCFLSFAACAPISKLTKKFQPLGEPKPVLVRGWTWVEDDKERLELGASEGQFTLGSATIVGDKVVFGSERFGVNVVNKKTGARIWSRKIDKGVNSQIAVHKDQIFFGADDGAFRCLDLQSGREVWHTELGFPVRGMPLFANDRLFAYTNDDALHALDPQTGKSLWVYRRPPNSRTRVIGGGNPTFFGGQVWLGFSDGSLLALDPTDGSIKNETAFTDNNKFSDIDAQPLPWRNGLLIATFDGKLHYVRKDMAQVWEFNAGGARAPLVGEDGNSLYLASSDGTIYNINGQSGTETWRFVLKRGVPTGLVLVKDSKGRHVLIAGTSHDQIIAVDAESGAELGSVNLGGNSGTYSSLAYDEETRTVFLLSSFSRLFQLRLQI